MRFMILGIASEDIISNRTALDVWDPALILAFLVVLSHLDVRVAGIPGTGFQFRAGDLLHALWFRHNGLDPALLHGREEIWSVPGRSLMPIDAVVSGVHVSNGAHCHVL